MTHPVKLSFFFYKQLATARPEPPVIGHSSGSLGPSSSSSSGPSGSLGYSYGPPPPSPSISVNSYGSATSEYGPPTQAPIIHKHVYVHVPPPEPEYQTTRRPPTRPFVVPPPQKHYKIVFIKAPSPPTVAPPVLPPVQQNEEKTLVYVLVKKQDEPEEIVIPTAAPTPPSKPEVYFIRYKTQVSGVLRSRPSSHPQPAIFVRQGRPSYLYAPFSGSRVRDGVRGEHRTAGLGRLRKEKETSRRMLRSVGGSVYFCSSK
uniref:DUF243 domain-containing protein n=1 Tax=Anopheles atroparvus TaxID=41427 RepID=A0AAG5DBS2_ANOAO